MSISLIQIIVILLVVLFLFTDVKSLFKNMLKNIEVCKKLVKEK